MNSLRAYIKKEFLEGLRTHKFLIVALGILFFAAADPVMLKLMPEILKSQMKGVDLSGIIELSQRAAMMSYTKDIYQIGTLVMVLALMGIISAERTEKTFTIPVSMGCSIGGIVAGKILVYGLYVILLTVTGMLAAWYYAGLIFQPGYGSWLAVLKAGLLYGTFFLFVLSVLALFSSLSTKPFVAGIAALLTAYLLPVLQGFQAIEKYLPTHLLDEAKYFNSAFSGELAVSLACTLGLVVVFNWLTAVRLKRIELV